MSLENLFNTTKKIYFEVMKKIFLDDFDNPDIYIDIEQAINEAINITKKDILDEEMREPLPGKLAQQVVKQFCLDMVVNLYPTEKKLTEHINYQILSTDAYRYLYKTNEDYKFIIDNLNNDFYNIWINNKSVNKNYALFTTKEKIAIFLTFITPFFPFGIAYIYKKIKNEKNANQIFTDEMYFLVLRFFKYSEILTYDLYKTEYQRYDIAYRNETKNDLNQE